MTTNLLSVIEQQHKALEAQQIEKECECKNCMQATAALAAGKQALEQPQGEMVPQAWTNLLAYVLQDDMHNRLTPRVVDIAYTAFTLAKRPNTEDGGASDWFNDTKPKVAELIAKLRKDLIEEMPATHPQATEPAPSTAGEREAWLIEVKSLGPSWICSISRENGFTRDANKAIQFPTKESAEAVLAHLWKAGRNGTVFGLDSSCYSVTEHIFLGATPPSHDAGKLVESLDSIRRYGLDTLSGRTDGPDDRDWQRQAVNEMTKRATAALLSAPALPAAAMQLADDFAAAAVNHYSAGENDKELWQKMADARQALETKLMEVK